MKLLEKHIHIIHTQKKTRAVQSWHKTQQPIHKQIQGGMPCHYYCICSLISFAQEDADCMVLHLWSWSPVLIIREKPTWTSKEESKLSPRSSENGIKPFSSELSQWCYTFQTLTLVPDIRGCSWSIEKFIRMQKCSVRTRTVLSKIRKLVTMPRSCTLARQ